jgi:hypothetical protein
MTGSAKQIQSMDTTVLVCFVASLLANDGKCDLIPPAAFRLILVSSKEK